LAAGLTCQLWLLALTCVEAARRFAASARMTVRPVAHRGA